MFKRMWKNARLWNDTHGGVISPEIAIVGAVLVIGVIVGLGALQVAINTETEDIAEAVQAIDFTPTVTPVDPPPMSASAASDEPPTTMADLIDK